MIKHIQRDDLDKPPRGQQLPEWSDAQRRADRPLPPWLIPSAVLAVCVVLLVVLAAAWPSLQALGELFRGSLVEYASAVRLVLFLAFLCTVAGAVGFVWRAGAAVGALGARARIVRTQHDAPIDVAALRRPEWGSVVEGSLLAHYLTQQTWAANSGQRNLAALTFSPAYHNRQDVQGDAPLPPALPLPAVPSFGELVAAGAIGQGVPMLLGIDAATGEPVRGSFKSLYSMGVGGLQGSGKTWTMASILAQSALHGARLVVCDPHAGDEESLATRVAGLAPAFLCDVAEDDRAILAALQLAAGELHARRGGAAQRWPLIVAIDEWTALRRGKLADLLPVLVEDFSTEGRKFNCHVALGAQRWDKASAGDFRNTLASAYVHRIRPDEARMLTGLPAGVLPNDTMGLAPGESYLVDTRGQLLRVVTPRMTVADVVIVGAQLRGAQPLSAGQGAIAASLAEAAEGLPFGFRPPLPAGTRQATGSHPAGKPEAPASASGRGAGLDAETAQIAALFLAGKSVPEIVVEVYGLSSSTGGRKYTDARERVEAALRRAMGGSSL